MRTRLAVALAAVVGGLVLAAPAPAQSATGCSQADSQAASQKYLDALTDRNAAWSVPFAPIVLRTENGVPTGFTALDLKTQLYLHIQYSVFTSLENVVWTWQPAGRPHVIKAVYDIPVGLADVPLGGSNVDEDFTLTAGCTIKRIDAKFTIEPPA